MSRKKKAILHLILILVEVISVGLFFWLLIEDYQILKYTPLAVGVVATFAHYWVAGHRDGEPEEWHGNVNVTEEHDE